MLAYRVIYGVTDQIVALGPELGDDSDDAGGARGWPSNSPRTARSCPNPAGRATLCAGESPHTAIEEGVWRR